MAKKRRSSGKRRASRRRRSMSDPGMSSRRGRKKSRRSGARRRRGMGEVFTATGFKRGLKTTGLGALGGGISKAADLILGENELVRTGVPMVGSVVLGAVSGERSAGELIAAGIAGGAGRAYLDRLEVQLMSDNEYANEDALSDYPDALSEDGKPLYLCDDGNLYFSDDFQQTPEGEFILSDGATPYNSNMAVVNY